MASLRPYKNDPNHYRVLGVTENATTDQIKGKYRKLTFQHHPDKAKKDPASQKEAAEEFRKIRAAWEVLSADRKGFDRELDFRRRDAKRDRSGFETGQPPPSAPQPSPGGTRPYPGGARPYPGGARPYPGGAQPGYGFTPQFPGFAPQFPSFNAYSARRGPSSPAYSTNGPGVYFAYNPGIPRPEAYSASGSTRAGAGASYRATGTGRKGGPDDGRSLDDDFWKSRGFKNQSPDDINASMTSARKAWLSTNGHDMSGGKVEKMEAVMGQLLKSQVALSSLLGSLNAHFHSRRATEYGEATSRILKRIIFLVGETLKANEENAHFCIQVFGGLAYGASVDASTIPLTLSWGRRLVQTIDQMCQAIATYDLGAFGTIGKPSDIELARKLEGKLMALPPIRAL